MPIYYVTHPNVNITAKVSAPATEKARTVFLDYLERQGKAPRKLRQVLRRNMVAERLEDPDTITADIDLSYSYGQEESQELFRPSEYVEEKIEPEAEIPASVEEPGPSFETPPPPPRLEPVRSGRSPIANASLGGFGL